MTKFLLSNNTFGKLHIEVFTSVEKLVRNIKSPTQKVHKMKPAHEPSGQEIADFIKQTEGRSVADMLRRSV